jgi:regulator of sigma E protease
MAALPQPGFLYSLVMMILMISVLVTVHEFGHYIVGRLFGTKVLTFSVGMGPEVMSWTDKKGTRWRIGALPIGGYCKFLGDMDATSRPDNEAHQFSADLKAQAFPFKPLWQRFLIVLAGPAINIFFAIALFWLLFMTFGAPPNAPVIGYMPSMQSVAPLQAGDRVLEIDGKSISNFNQVAEIIVQSPAQKLAFKVARGEQTLALDVVTGKLQEKDRWGNIYDFGRLDIAPHVPAIAGRVHDDTAAAKAGFQSGDEIVEINGVKPLGFAHLRSLVQAQPGVDMRMRVKREGTDKWLTVTPRARTISFRDGTKKTIGEIGLEFKNEKVGPFAAVSYATAECWHRVDQAVTQLGRMITGRVPLDQMGGMLRIGEAAGMAAARGWDYFVNLMALISITLAVMNLLPVPVLDGGHLALYAAEAVRGRPLNPKVMELAFSAGFFLIVGLMLFLFWNDLRLFGVWRSLAELWS